MFDFEEVDPSEKTRLITVSNGVTYKARMTDPYGFWHIEADKGQLPTVLRGQYTTFEQAKSAIQNYVNDIREKIVKVTAPKDEGYEPGASKEDEYNPPNLQIKQKVKRVSDNISLG